MVDITASELQKNFALFDNWEDRYSYLIDLGRNLPHMDESLKTEENRVHGCVSKVWLVSGFNDGRLDFIADSDTQLVRGLIAVLMMAYKGKTPVEVGEVDVEGLFRRLGLEQHLSPNRRSGFFSMVEAIRKSAEQA
jgi:cysteine desulfuration protein SufE